MIRCRAELRDAETSITEWCTKFLSLMSPMLILFTYLFCQGIMLILKGNKRLKLSTTYIMILFPGFAIFSIPFLKKLSKQS
jgi:hypothetical protein